MLTWHAAPHIRAQVLSIGAGAGVFGRVFCYLWSLEAQVLAASVSHAAQITAVRPCNRQQEVERGEPVKHVIKHGVWLPKLSRVRAFGHTLRLSELMEDDDVVGVVEVLGQRLDVLKAQPVGHEDRRSVSVRPVDTILQRKHSKSWCGLFPYLILVFK